MMQNLMGNNISKVPRNPPWGNFFRGRNSKWLPKICKLARILTWLMFLSSDSQNDLSCICVALIQQWLISLVFYLRLGVKRSPKLGQTGSFLVNSEPNQIASYFEGNCKIRTNKWFASECDLLIQKYRSPKVGYKGHVKAICSEGFT